VVRVYPRQAKRKLANEDGKPDGQPTKTPGYSPEWTFTLRGPAFTSFNYSVNSLAGGYNGQASGQEFNFSLETEFRFQPNWSLDLNLSATDYELSSASYLEKNADLSVVWDFSIFGEDSGWKLSPRLGVTYREYFEGSPSGITSALPNIFGTLGPSLGLEVSKKITERLTLGLRFDTTLPLIAMGLPTGGTVTVSPLANYRITVEGNYNLGKDWSASVTGFYDQRGISATPDAGYAADVIGISSVSGTVGFKYKLPH
jgi:hypothetical protein